MRIHRLPPKVRTRLAEILADFARIDTDAERKVFLANLGLPPSLSAAIPITGAASEFADRFIYECENFGRVAGSNHPVLYDVISTLSAQVPGQPGIQAELAEIQKVLDAAPLESPPQPQVPRVVVGLVAGLVVVSLVALYVIVGGGRTLWGVRPEITVVATSAGASLATFTPGATSTTVPTALVPTTTLNRPTDAVPAPPADATALRDWLRLIVAGHYDQASVRDVLLSNQLIASADDWRTDVDITGDTIPDWILATTPNRDLCSNLYLVDGQSGTILGDSQQYTGSPVITTLARVDDLTGDGVSDVLYRVKACDQPLTEMYYLYTIQTENPDRIVTSQHNAYLALLLANDLFAEEAYTAALQLYETLLYDEGTLAASGWTPDAISERTVIHMIAGVRAELTVYQLAGTSGGYLPTLVERYDTDNIYVSALVSFENTYAASGDVAASCAAFRDTVRTTFENAGLDPLLMTEPLDEIGVLHFIYVDICPF